MKETFAYVNHGRWVANCPACPSAELVTPGRVGFACHECRQVARVVWPDLGRRVAIERVLVMRPVLETRNWLPNETVADLKRENELHGLGVG